MCSLRELHTCDGQTVPTSRYGRAVCPCREERSRERVQAWWDLALLSDVALDQWTATQLLGGPVD